MTVPTTSPRIAYAGNDSTTVFSVPYYFLADADLVVKSRVTATGVETLKALTTDYTVSGAGVPAGGSVTMLVAPATGTTLTIIRDPAVTQTADYVANDTFPAETHERALDKLTMVAQRLYDKLTRSLQFADTSTASGVTVPDPEAALFLRWNALGTALENAAMAALGAIGIPVSVAEGGTGVTSTAAAFTAIVAPGGSLTGRIADKHGADIASAATLVLDNATGNIVDVTGTTDITAITLADGAEVIVRFTGALTITNGASLVCLGAANITTVAGDYAVFRGYASSVVRMQAYFRLDGEAINERQATAIASSGTTDLATVKGRYAHITGTTSITAFGTVPAGVRKTLVFDGILTLTHNGTSLIIPGAANITTAAGDIVEVVSEGSGNWRVVDYRRAVQAPIIMAVARMTADVAVTASTTLTNDTNLLFALVSGVRYNFKFTIIYDSDTPTTGLKIGLTHPGAAGLDSFGAHVSIGGLTAAGAAATFEGDIVASGGSVSSTAVANANNGYIATIEGFIKPNANGNLQVQHACEVAAGIVTVYEGSSGILTTLP